MSKRSRRALHRSTAGDRSLVLLSGLVLLALGVLVVLLGAGVFGSNRAQRPLLDPVVVEWTTANTQAARWIAIVAGIVLLVVGVTWAIRSLRPEPRTDVLLSDTPGQRLSVEHAAIEQAVRADVEALDGVDRARVKVVGTERQPALRLSIWLREGTDVHDIWAGLDDRVLARARTAFDVEALPTAVRLELEAAATHTARVR